MGIIPLENSAHSNIELFATFDDTQQVIKIQMIKNILQSQFKSVIFVFPFNIVELRTNTFDFAEYFLTLLIVFPLNLLKSHLNLSYSKIY